jgi:predicted ATPase
MITKLRITNFKCLRDTGPLDIRPLTLLVGPNSSGKSSLLQMLLMLRQTVDSTDFRNALATNDGWIQMGTYPEFVFKARSTATLGVEMTFQPAARAEGTSGGKPPELHLKATFSYNHKSTQIEFGESDIRLNGKRQRVFRDPKTAGYRGIITTVEKGKRKVKSSKNVMPWKFYGFAPWGKDVFEKTGIARALPALTGLIVGLGLIVEVEFRDMFYLGPLRELPRRFYVAGGQAPKDVGTRGERAADVFWFSHWAEEKRMWRVKEEVKKWFRSFGIAKDVRLDRVSRRQNHYRILITDPATRVETSFADIGFGASQTLPVIIESFFAPPGSIILIEQPEIHLHPRAQSILGDLFIEAAADGNRTFLVETHSEHILARIRRRIAEGGIKRENVAIYYFQPTAEGTKIQEVTLNKQGQYVSFPDGFFEEDVAEAFAHLAAMRRRRKK